MGLGFSKDFVIFIFISIIAGFISESWQTGAGIFLAYIICKIIWGILT